MKKNCLMLIFTTFIFVSCSPVKYGCFDIRDGLEYEFAQITEMSSSFKNLNEKILFIDKSDPEYSKALNSNRLIKITLTSDFNFNSKIPVNSKKIKKASTDTAKNITGKSVSAVFKRELHIPVTDFRNTETNAERKDILNLTYKTDTAENILLPEKGLSFEGLYPDNENYILFRDLRVSALLPEKITEETSSLINNWLDEIDIDKDPKNPVKAASENKKDKITWTGAVGDIMPGRGVENILIWGENGKERIFSDTLPVLQGFDLLIGNLEGPVTKHKTIIEKAYNFKFRHKVLGELKNSGFDYLSAVNNHCFDYEETGFLDTLSYLKYYDIKTSGAGINLEEALTPARFSINGADYNILALADYPAEKDKFDGRKETEAGIEQAGILWPSEKVFSAVRKMAGEEGVNIVSVHGGYEWQNQPAYNQKKLFRKLADLGADIVIGSHPHVLQPVEEHNGSLIVYSLGNFVFSGMDETEFGEESMILSLGFYRDKLLYINYIPVNIDMQYLSLDKSGKILSRFEELNKDFSK